VSLRCWNILSNLLFWMRQLLTWSSYSKGTWMDSRRLRQTILFPCLRKRSKGGRSLSKIIRPGHRHPPYSERKKRVPDLLRSSSTSRVSVPEIQQHNIAVYPLLPRNIPCALYRFRLDSIEARICTPWCGLHGVETRSESCGSSQLDASRCFTRNRIEHIRIW